MATLLQILPTRETRRHLLQKGQGLRSCPILESIPNRAGSPLLEGGKQLLN